jgi:DNA modification methylase
VTATWRIIEGDCRETLASLPAGSVQTCVTSPPYFGLRDYGHGGQIGLEPTLDEFVAALVGVFREVRRVLRDDGTVWLNLGDSYANSARGNAPGDIESSNLSGGGGYQDGIARGGFDKSRLPGVKQKDLLGVPWMVAFALRADGWYLRSDIIWSKPNPMPESVTDRPTKAHEYVFLLSKGPRYSYDADAIREEAQDWGSRDRSGPLYDGSVGPQSGHTGLRDLNHTESGRNKRSVWTVATQPFPGAHFATFPPKLIEPCILAGCPERACGECGAPWERIVERTAADAAAMRPKDPRQFLGASPKSTLGHSNSHDGAVRVGQARTLGFAPSCGHDAPHVPGVVLDPFAGAGTTGMVALRHGRSFVGCELSADYVRLARDRIIADSPLLNTHAEMAA